MAVVKIEKSSLIRDLSRARSAHIIIISKIVAVVKIEKSDT